MNARPIGVFDSGLGGLTVVNEIKKALPYEDIIYLGDTARVPYGTRSKEVVKKFSLEDAIFLITRKVKCLVIACNTSSALGASEVRKISPVPVFDAISPTVKKVATLSLRKTGVIGTRGTIGSHAYRDAIKKLNAKSKIIELACPLLVPAIEEGETSGQLIRALIRKYLTPLKKEKIDSLILACTHYPIIKKEIKRFMGQGVALIDPAEEIAASLSLYLEEKNLLAPENPKAKRIYFVTDLTSRFIGVAEMFLGERISGSIKKVSL
ncbi:glutamate racemase [Candidatus Woesebacteria bacterium RIFCSPLOWO2_01_FULL_43_11]|uniref:Glutamate racemase n=1 Tax=Candidatus Woesebacteria bacterium RBG_16_42_24 TaxID=1802485 RepID=A0A1F7XLE0_9BACT|nr:MAG: glutamate racemase [Candidatus Woesebacteria bacterium RBG_16_42_24]OGM67846.1 MAG: glutamate racemase [Candidatus Woesebacteria bacterium RIFCSPLOWO2_01_FULL_43_11]